jgi:hypothetical protein
MKKLQTMTLKNSMEKLEEIISECIYNLNEDFWNEISVLYTEHVNS